MFAITPVPPERLKCKDDAFHRAEVLSADERTRTSTGYAHQDLNLARLPVPPRPRAPDSRSAGARHPSDGLGR